LRATVNPRSDESRASTSPGDCSCVSPPLQAVGAVAMNPAKPSASES
jgi:hypothetical protein